MDIFRTLIVEPVFNLLISIYSVVGDFGVALIIFTIIIRLLLWPLVTRQLHQVKAMRKLQPELAKIKKASKGNRQLESMQMLELYKRHGVKPFRSILMLLIQLPIFIALFQVIMIFTNSRDQIADYAYGFVENIPAVASLLQNPELFNQKLLGLIDLSASAFSGSDFVNSLLLVTLAGLAAFTQYIVSKQTTPQTSGKRLRDVFSAAAEGKDVDQSEVNAVMMTKMVKFLPIMMFVIMLNLPGALAFYYAISNLLTAGQQFYLLRRDADTMDNIANEAVKKQAKSKTPNKKATAKAREKQATEANITRISAKDTGRKKS